MENTQTITIRQTKAIKIIFGYVIFKANLTGPLSFTIPEETDLNTVYWTPGSDEKNISRKERITMAKLLATTSGNQVCPVAIVKDLFLSLFLQYHAVKCLIRLEVSFVRYPRLISKQG